jgi:hypothetical protein
MTPGNSNLFADTPQNDLIAEGGARRRVLYLNSNSPAIGLPSIEFQKLVVSCAGTLS